MTSHSRESVVYARVRGMEKVKLTRRQKEKQRQRGEILGAAFELFSEKGFHNVSMHEIAEKAEFAIGTIYKFFQNKEDLYKALVLEKCDMFEQSILESIAEADDEIGKLRNYIRTKGERFRANVRFIRLLFAESRGVSFNINAGVDEEVRRRYYRFLESIASIFESGIRKKIFRRLASPYRLAVALDSVVDSFLLLWLEWPESHPYPEDPDVILEIFLRGLIEA